jgi:glucosamine--fructose-6-phosphate aminotransferase (isomerizing)
VLTSVPPPATDPADRGTPAFWREIHEQPAAAERTLSGLEAAAAHRVAALRERPALRGKGLLLVGSGTSRHAAEIAAAWFRAAGLPTSVSPAGEIHGPLSEHGCDGALVAVTQSGETGSVLRLLDQAGQEGIFRVVVTNEAESAAARRADLAYVTRAGRETAIPATKSFTAALLALRIFGAEWAACSPDAPGGCLARAPEIREVPERLRNAIGHAPRLERFVRRVAADRTWFFLGCGPLLPLAAEGALKMMETAVVPAIALRTEELVHGPLALVDRETPVVLLSEPGGVSPGESRALAALADAGAPLLRLATEDTSGADAEWTLVSAGVPWLRPFETAPVLQLLAFFAGRRLGRNVDAPAGLQKAVRDD